MRRLWTLWILFCFTAAAAAQPPPAKVVTDPVTERRVAPTTRIVGVVDFDNRSGISPEVSGLIEEQAAVEGTVVRKGDVLVRLSTQFVEKDIAIRKKEAEQIGVKIANARRNLKRFEALLKGNAASQKAYDDLADTLRELVKQREMVRITVEKLELEKEKSTIRSPFDGLVLEKLKNVGEWVDPGVPIVRVGALDSLVVEVAVSEDLVRYISPGTEISLVINALDREFIGEVSRFEPVADPATKTFQIQIAIPYFEEAIQNMSATVNVPSGKERRLRMIKRDALVRNQGKTFVYTIKDGKAAILPVEIVAYEGEYVGVDAPHIQAGMEVVVDGNDRLRPDQPVEVIEDAGNGGDGNKPRKGGKA